MKRVLVLCTGNSCRSQMAEGWLKLFLKGNFQVYSAGTKPEKVNLNAVKVMKEVGIDISQHSSNHVDEYKDIKMDFLFSVCDNAKNICPVFPNAKRSFHQNFPDPASAIGDEDEVLEEYRVARDLLKTYFKEQIRSIK